jgi:PIN domain nuclease of toxin-antitoxin system
LKLLLDTHAALWFVGGDQHLSQVAHCHLTDRSNLVLLSAVVVLEISIKRSLGKLKVPDDYMDLLLGAGAQALPLSIDHASSVERLPWHHRDPFDRMLIAQAGIEAAGVVTRDARFAEYGVAVIW